MPRTAAVVVCLLLAACSRSYQVVQVPEYGADLYPLSQTKSGVTIAVDEIRRPERAERFFGVDLVKEGIVPVNVVISNFGKQRVLIKPSDILLYRGKEIIDPLPIEMVQATVKRQRSFLAASTETQVDKFFESSTFKEAVLLPSESYRGVVFFAPPPAKTLGDRWFRVLYAYSEGGPRIRLGVTNLESGDRMLFGPFQVVLPQN